MVQKSKHCKIYKVKSVPPISAFVQTIPHPHSNLPEVNFACIFSGYMQIEAEAIYSYFSFLLKQMIAHSL